MTDTWQARALLLIARTLLRCERHLLRLDRDGKLGIKTKKTALEVRKRRRESKEQEDDLDDIDYADEEDLASADAMLKSKKRKTFPIFNLLPFGSGSSDYDMDDELDEDPLELEPELEPPL